MRPKALFESVYLPRQILEARDMLTIATTSPGTAKLRKNVFPCSPGLLGNPGL